MKKVTLLIVAWSCCSAIGKCVESEYRAQISRGLSQEVNVISNITFNVLSEDGKNIVLLVPDVQSCVKCVENGYAHFVDLDCGVHLQRGALSSEMELKKYCFGMVRCSRVGDSHTGEVICCGRGQIKFYFKDVLRAGTDAAKKSQRILGSEWCAESQREKCFLASGVRRLLTYCENGTSRTYLKNTLDHDKWLVLSYVLWVDLSHDVETDQRLLFRYDIARVTGNSIASERKGMLPIWVKDKCASQADGVRIVMTRRAEWNFDLDVRFDDVGCQIRVFQHDINESVRAWNVK